MENLEDIMSQMIQGFSPCLFFKLSCSTNECSIFHRAGMSFSPVLEIMFAILTRNVLYLEAVIKEEMGN